MTIIDLLIIDLQPHYVAMEPIVSVKAIVEYVAITVVLLYGTHKTRYKYNK